MTQVLAAIAGVITVVMGLAALAKGETKLSRTKTLKGRSARIAGAMVVGLGVGIVAVALVGIPWIMGDPSVIDALLSATAEPRRQGVPQSNPRKLARFVSKEAGFAIDFLGQPEIERTGPNPAIVKAKGMNFLVDLGDRTFGVYYTQYSVKRNGSKEELDAARDMVKRALGGTLVREKDFSAHGFSGRECVILYGEGLAVRFRVLVSDFIAYSVIASVPRGEESSQEVDAFLDSFEILKP